MKVVITAAAKTDLVAIADFIRPHNPARAETFIDELLDRCAELADMSRAYPLIPRYEQWVIRRRVHRGYLIFYRALEDRVEIIHVLNEAQDYEILLFPDP